jgi:polyribonucleotide nucleotidyltransferase
MSVATERIATVTASVGGRDITFETGKLAKQAGKGGRRSGRS